MRPLRTESSWRKVDNPWVISALHVGLFCCPGDIFRELSILEFGKCALAHERNMSSDLHCVTSQFPDSGSYSVSCIHYALTPNGVNVDYPPCAIFLA